MMIKKEFLNWRELIVLVSSLALLLARYPVSAQEQTVASDPIQATGLIDPDELESFIDRYVRDNMEAAHVPGLTIVVVRDGEALLSKGYGYADLENQTPMTPQTSVRGGSISKPVLAAVVMQLVEQGLVDLDAPVSQYITDLNLTDEFGQASAVGQLLTHMGGYDDIVVLSHAPTYEAWQPLGEYLADNPFPRSLPPGKVMSYSSYGYALLGYGIEEAMGMPYEEIAAGHLFAPMGMNMTTFTQPLPPEIEANLGTGYRYKGDNYQIVPHDFVKMSPGVAMVTTGEDMGKFMLALLSGGVVDGTRIMAEETADTLLRRQVGISPQIPGRSYAFWENSYSGRQVLTHEGNGIGFSNVIALAPEQNFGLYIVANHQVFDKGASPSAAYRFILSLRAAVVEEFLPETEGKTLGQPLPDAAERTSRYAGHYQPTNFSQTDFFKLARLTDAFDVKDNGDGTINIGSKSYIEIEPQVFQSVDYPDLIWSFVENDQGEVEFLTLGRGASYQKAAWYENANFHKVLAGVTALLFLSMLIVWPFTRQGHWVILVVSLLDLIVLVGFGVLMFNANIIVWYKTIPLGLRLLQSLPWVSGLLSLSLPVFLVAKWKDSDASWWGRMHYLLVTLASYAFFWFANFWKLVLK